MQIICPRGLAEQWTREVQADMSIPSPTTMSRVRARVDASWMIIFRQLMARKFAAGGVAMYVVWDASPHGGRDYQMGVADIVSVKDLAQMHCDIQKLELRHHYMFVS